MKLASSISKHFNGVYKGPNWSDNNLKDHLNDITWKEAIHKMEGVNTILQLSYHVHYYVQGVTKVLEGGSLSIRDKYSFDHPEVNGEQDWEELRKEIFEAGEKFAILISGMNEEQFWTDFTDEKYGNYFTNLIGILEHLHYHLGQIVILKKMIRAQSK